MYSNIMHGLLTGFLWPVIPILLFRDPPLPNFFDADAEASSCGNDEVGSRVAAAEGVGGETLPSVVFGQRMQVSTMPYGFIGVSLGGRANFTQMGIVLGFALNLAFGALRMLN